MEILSVPSPFGCLRQLTEEMITSSHFYTRDSEISCQTLFYEEKQCINFVFITEDYKKMLTCSASNFLS